MITSGTPILGNPQLTVQLGNQDKSSTEFEVTIYSPSGSQKSPPQILVTKWRTTQPWHVADIANLSDYPRDPWLPWLKSPIRPGIFTESSASICGPGRDHWSHRGRSMAKNIPLTELEMAMFPQHIWFFWSFVVLVVQKKCHYYPMKIMKMSWLSHYYHRLMG